MEQEEIKVVLPYFENLIAEMQTNKVLKRDKIMNLLDIIQIELARKYNEIYIHEAHSYNVKIKNLEQLLETKFK